MKIFVQKFLFWISSGKREYYIDGRAARYYWLYCSGSMFKTVTNLMFTATGEMVGRRKNLELGVSQTSEIYYPHWIYKRAEEDKELGLRDIENVEDKEYAMKLIRVSLWWCIQANPSNRPAISRVVKMLEGSLDTLQFPPQPCLFSPSSEPADSST